MMPNYNQDLQQNNTELDQILQTVNNLPEAGSPPVIQSLKITQNGITTAPVGVDGYNPIEVAIVGSSDFDALIDHSITEVTSNATGVADYVFNRCKALTTIDFPVAEIIGNYAFEFCKVLTTINFPSVTSIRDYAFRYCEALTTINFPAVTSIGNHAFDRCKALTAIDFPVAEIIGDYALNNCRALTTINFPAVTSIGYSAFYFCSALTTVDFPAVTNIENYAFDFCKALTTVILGSPTLCKASGDPNINSTAFIYVPKALIEQYKIATNWSKYATQFRAIEDYPDIVGG